MFKSHITLSLGLLVSSILSGQTILYVDKDAPNADGDGLSWATAFKHLNDALDIVNAQNADSEIGITVCVAEGTYYPDEGANRINDEQTSTFNITGSNTRIIGGFRGDEVSFSQANPEICVTTLSGLIYEEYGITDLGVDQLINLSRGVLEGFVLVNKSNSNGTIVEGVILPTLLNCRIVNSTSGGDLLNNLKLENCSITNCRSSSRIAFNLDCYNTIFEGNEAPYLIYYPRNNIIDCMFLENVASQDLINVYNRTTNISNTVFYRNIAGEYIINSRVSSSNQVYGLKLRGLTYVDNFNQQNSVEIYAEKYIYLEKSLFFRSSLNRSPIVGSVTLGYNASSQGNHLPMDSKFFGISSYANLGSPAYYSETRTDFYGILSDQNIFNGSSITESLFLSSVIIPSGNIWVGGGFMVNMNYTMANTLINEGVNFNGSNLGSDSYTPELIATFFPSITIPDPFIDSDNPLGADGIPFTSDDGLNLDPNSAWADEVINTPTINYDYGSTDILGNDRIIGGKIDLGAYEYTPLSDADGDGVSDADDAFDDDPAEYADTDGDLIGDNADDDDDGDGIPDTTEIAAGLDPKQYNGSLFNFVQSLGQGTFTEMELQEARQAAINGVLSDPTSYDLYTPSSIMDLNFGGVMIQASESGNLDFSYTIESSDDLTTWETHSQPTIEITPSGSKHFMRIRIGEP